MLAGNLFKLSYMQVLIHARQAYLAQTAQQNYLLRPEPTLKIADTLSWQWY